jgi:hypothetical protein
MLATVHLYAVWYKQSSLDIHGRHRVSGYAALYLPPCHEEQFASNGALAVHDDKAVISRQRHPREQSIRASVEDSFSRLVLLEPQRRMSGSLQRDFLTPSSLLALWLDSDCVI